MPANLPPQYFEAEKRFRSAQSPLSVLTYSDLHVYDAGGVELESRFLVRGARIEIIIDCRGAVFPLHVDPLLTAYSWSSSTVMTTTDIAWGVINFLESPEKSKWLGKNGRKRVLAEFTWDKIAEKTIELYEKIAKR